MKDNKNIKVCLVGSSGGHLTHLYMQSQFGRDVLGVVRLDEARRLKAKAKEILVDISNDTDKDTMKSLKQEAKSEKQGYSQLKKRACKRCSG